MVTHTKRWTVLLLVGAAACLPVAEPSDVIERTPSPTRPLAPMGQSTDGGTGGNGVIDGPGSGGGTVTDTNTGTGTNNPGTGTGTGTPAATNRAPELQGPTVQPSAAMSGQMVTLNATVTDADGDPLTYAWSQVTPATPAGTFSNATAANPTWTAPTVTAATSVTLGLIVRDGKGGQDEGQVVVNVMPAPPANQPPTVSANITAPATLEAGVPATLSVTATDPEGAQVTYAWTQMNPATQGTWRAGQNAASATWFSPEIAAATTFTFQVAVSDGTNTVTRTVQVPVTVPTLATLQPLFTTNCVPCHGASGNLTLTAAMAQAELVNVDTVNAAAACANLPRVMPGNPNMSSLVLKISGATCGNRMPNGNANFFVANPEHIVRIRSWIAGGAN